MARLYDPLASGHRPRHGAVVLPGEHLPRVLRGRPVEIHQSPVATRLRALRYLTPANCLRVRFLAAPAPLHPASDELSCPRCGATDPDFTVVPPGPSCQVVWPGVPAWVSSGHSPDPAVALRQPWFAEHVCAFLSRRNHAVVAAG